MMDQTASVKEISCEQCRELLSDYVDRELSADEKTSVEKHLTSCLKCGSESARLVGLKKIVQNWQGVRSSGEFRQSVMQRMIRESQQVPSSQFTEAAAESARMNADMENLQEKTLPPIWILLAFSVLAVGAYYFVLWLRGA